MITLLWRMGYVPSVKKTLEYRVILFITFIYIIYLFNSSTVWKTIMEDIMARNRNKTDLMTAACGIPANASAHRLPAVPPERAGPEEILLRRPPYRHRPLRTRLAGGMPRLHYHLADSAAAKGEVAVLGPLRWILINQH